MKPVIHPLQDLDLLDERGWFFEPAWWMVEQFGGREFLFEQADKACKLGWNTCATLGNEVIAIGGVSPIKYWHGYVTEAVAWTIPSHLVKEYPGFTFRWASQVHKVQKANLIPRIEAFVIFPPYHHRLLQTPFRYYDHSVDFLDRLGFEREGMRSCWFRGQDADCFTLIKPENWAEIERQHHLRA